MLNLATLEATCCAHQLLFLEKNRSCGQLEVLLMKSFDFKEAASGEKSRWETGFDGKQFLMRLFLSEAIKIT